MAALDFPANPTVGQQYAAPNGVTYQWDGAAWVVTGGPPGQLWTAAGGTLTPTDTTNVVAIPSTTENSLTWGSRTIKGRLTQNAATDGIVNIRANMNQAGTQDDATKPSWALRFGCDNDTLQTAHWAAGGTSTTPLSVSGAGVLTVPGPPASNPDNASLVIGSRTQKGRLMALPGLDWAGLSLNRRYNGSAWTRDDAAQPSWTLNLSANLNLAYENAAGILTNPFYVQGTDGKTYCTLADTSITTAMLAAGSTVRSWATGTIPSNFTVTGNATWQRVAITGSYASRGGRFLVYVPFSFACLISASSGIWMGLGYNNSANNIYQLRFSTSSSIVIGGTLVGLVAPAAGTYTFELWAQASSGSIVTPVDSAGSIVAIEFA